MIKEITVVEETQKATEKGMKDDIVVKQTFSCCGHSNEKFFWEGWDWVDGDIISEELTDEFMFCPYCGKRLQKVEDDNDG